MTPSRPGGTAAPCSGRFDAKGAWTSVLTTRTPRFDQDGKKISGVDKVFNTKVFEDNVWGLEWFDGAKNAMGRFPQYFKHAGEKRIAVSAAEVPAETRLQAREFKRAGQGQPYTSPAEGPGQARSGAGSRSRSISTDGSTVTYCWYRFVDQPSFQQYAWSEEKKAKLQAFVEKIHVHWPIDKDYMAPLRRGSLAALDPALLVTPPKGLEAGYVADPWSIRKAAACPFHGEMAAQEWSRGRADPSGRPPPAAECEGGIEMRMSGDKNFPGAASLNASRSGGSVPLGRALLSPVKLGLGGGRPEAFFHPGLADDDASDSRPETGGLRSLAAGKGLLIGSAFSNDAFRNDPLYGEVLAREFNCLVAENTMKLDVIQRVRGRFDFGPADEMMAFAGWKGMKVRAVPLVWHDALPDWAQDKTFPRQEALDILRGHIFTVMGHFQGACSPGMS